MQKKRGKLSQLFINLRYLAKTDLRDELDKRFVEFEDYYRYMLRDEPLVIPRPHILNAEETIELLLNEPKSFSRFGDGEINIMTGSKTDMHHADPRLASYLWEIIKNQNENLYVGLPYGWFHANENSQDFVKEYLRRNSYKYRQLVLPVCNMNRVYIAAGFNQVYMNTEGLDYDTYFSKVKKLFKGRKIVLFAGKGILNKLDYDIFDEVAERINVDGPVYNSFDYFDELFEKAKSFSKEYTLCFILGPVSKVLCYELSKLGYLAWDLGHLAKDYDAYCKKIEKTTKEAHAKFMQTE